MTVFGFGNFKNSSQEYHNPTNYPWMENQYNEY